MDPNCSTPSVVEQLASQFVIEIWKHFDFHLAFGPVHDTAAIPSMQSTILSTSTETANSHHDECEPSNPASAPQTLASSVPPLNLLDLTQQHNAPTLVSKRPDFDSNPAARMAAVRFVQSVLLVQTTEQAVLASLVRKHTRATATTEQVVEHITPQPHTQQGHKVDDVPSHGNHEHQRSKSPKASLSTKTSDEKDAVPRYDAKAPTNPSQTKLEPISVGKEAKSGSRYPTAVREALIPPSSGNSSSTQSSPKPAKSANKQNRAVKNADMAEGAKVEFSEEPSASTASEARSTIVAPPKDKKKPKEPEKLIPPANTPPLRKSGSTACTSPKAKAASLAISPTEEKRKQPKSPPSAKPSPSSSSRLVSQSLSSTSSISRPQQIQEYVNQVIHQAVQRILQTHVPIKESKSQGSKKGEIVQHKTRQKSPNVRQRNVTESKTPRAVSPQPQQPKSSPKHVSPHHKTTPKTTQPPEETTTDGRDESLQQASTTTPQKQKQLSPLKNVTPRNKKASRKRVASSQESYVEASISSFCVPSEKTIETMLPSTQKAIHLYLTPKQQERRDHVNTHSVLTQTDDSLLLHAPPTTAPPLTTGSLGEIHAVDQHKKKKTKRAPTVPAVITTRTGRTLAASLRKSPLASSTAPPAPKSPPHCPANSPTNSSMAMRSPAVALAMNMHTTAASMIRKAAMESLHDFKKPKRSGFCQRCVYEGRTCKISDCLRHQMLK